MNSFKTYSLSITQKQKIKSLIKTELERHNKIAFTYIYVSFIEPEMPFFRDIDIGIYLKNYKVTDYLKHEIELSIELEKSLQYKYPIDLTKWRIHPLIFYNIFTQKILHYHLLNFSGFLFFEQIS